MRSRRQFLGGSLAVAGLGLLPGCGLPSLTPRPTSRVARIGWLATARTDDPVRVRLSGAFRQGLRDLGWVEGETVVIDFRSAEGRSDKVPALAAELVRLQPDVIVVASGATALRPLRDATDTIPIVVGSFGGDPVADGFATSLARPGGNVTGLSSIAPELSGKRLELLRTAIPGVSRVAVFWNAAVPSLRSDWQQTEAASEGLGLRLLPFVIRGPDDFETAFSAVSSQATDALLSLPDAVTLTYRARIVEFAARARLPAMYAFRESAEDGGLMAYGPSLPDMFRRAAAYVDKILRGASPADLPIERPATFDFLINLKTATALGLIIPQPVLQQATEIIQ